MMKIKRSMIRCLFFSCLYCCTLGVQAEAEDIQPSCSWNIGTENIVFVPLSGEEEHEEILIVYRKNNENPAVQHFTQAFSFE